MSKYYGRDPFRANLSVEKFIGNGSQTSWTLQYNPGSITAIQVYLDGVLQIPGSAFTYVAYTITFSEPVPSGINILVFYLGQLSQTVAPIDGSVNSGKLDPSGLTLPAPSYTATPAAGDNSNKIATTAFVAANGVPSGCILMWSGSIISIPSGWHLCDGTLGTPDLRDRFVIGSGNNYGVNATGGSANSIVVAHTHGATSSVNDPGHSHGLQNLGSAQAGSDNGGAPITASTGYSTGRNSVGTTAATTGITVSTTVSSTGSSGTNANLPPYFSLAFIQKL